ncbi:hypothetical protein ACLMJK_004530 [Lecanora helva]
MADPLDSEDGIFGRLRKGVDPKVQEEKTRLANERDLARYAKVQQRMSTAIQDNSTLPTTISNIHIRGATRTRKSFLDRIFNPILSTQPSTLEEAINQVSVGAEKLRRLDIFNEPISLFIDRPDQSDPSTTPTDINFFLSVQERSRLNLKTGTSVGNAEGDAYVNGTFRNVFGGAETLNVNGSLGTRTRSAYEANFETPILSNPDFRFQFGGLSSSTSKIWSSHEEVLKGGWAKLRWLAPGGGKHELGYNSVWRQVTGLADRASPTVRGDAGDSVKNSLTLTLVNDRRDDALLPTRGIFNKSTLELAGWGPLQGDVAFAKAELEAQAAVPIPIPGVKGDSGVSFTTGLRAGLLHPLPLGLNSESKPSRINDRFSLGGPTDVRGFRLSGLGPRDGGDSVGGDVYAAGSANLLFPVPGVGIDKPFRFQAFVNGGRLLALKKTDKEGNHAQQVRQSVKSTIAELGSGLPSMAAGFGLVYAHPIARFELNFSLPLVLRKGEDGRKGLQFGVGIDML